MTSGDPDISVESPLPGSEESSTLEGLIFSISPMKHQIEITRSNQTYCWI